MSKEPSFGCDLNGGSTSSSPTKSYDVYIGFLGRRRASLLRFVKWLHAELQLQGVSSFVSYTNRRSDSRAAMISAYVSLIIITEDTFSDPHWIDEVWVFINRRNFLPIFFGFGLGKVGDLVEHIEERKEGKLWNGLGGLHSQNWQSVVDWIRWLKLKLEANAGNWRDCISEAVVFVGKKLGRRSVVKKVRKWKEWSRNEEFLFPQNKSFVGRKKELDELELRLFGYIEEGEGLELDTTSGGRGCGGGGLTRKDKEPMEHNVSHNASSHNVSSRNVSSHNVSSHKIHEKCIKGFAWVTGDSGIGKTELLIEFAYKLRSRYKNVLWIGGEARYIWHNYLNLLPSLGIDVGLKEGEEDNTSGDYLRTFDEAEDEAICRVKKELTRGIPYLIVIDNLENDKDWWRGRSMMELLPELGKDTHVIISTRVEEVVRNEDLRMRLLPLSPAEAMSLMVKGSAANLGMDDDICALRMILERLNGITLGISIVQAILLELHMSPKKLLRSINRMPYSYRDMTSNEELSAVGRNKVLIQLVHFCLLVFDLVDKSRNLASRMVKASGWFAPSPIPTPLLVSAAFKIPIRHKSWKWRIRRITSLGNCTNEDRLVQKASSMLVRFHMAKRCAKDGFLHFNDIIRLYSRKRYSKSGVFAMVEAVNLNASLSLPHNYDHIWEACYKVLKFDAEPTIIELTPSKLISFVKTHVIPLAMKILATSCHHTCALELLRRSTEKLELVEGYVGASIHREAHGSLCWWLNAEFDPLIYRELFLLKAAHLELRAKIMCRGGSLDIGEELYRKALRIKEVFLGLNLSETASTQEIMRNLLIKESETTSLETPDSVSDRILTSVS